MEMTNDGLIKLLDEQAKVFEDRARVIRNAISALHGGAPPTPAAPSPIRQPKPRKNSRGAGKLCCDKCGKTFNTTGWRDRHQEKCGAKKQDCHPEPERDLKSSGHHKTVLVIGVPLDRQTALDEQFSGLFTLLHAPPHLDLALIARAERAVFVRGASGEWRFATINKLGEKNVTVAADFAECIKQLEKLS